MEGFVLFLIACSLLGAFVLWKNSKDEDRKFPDRPPREDGPER